MAPHKAKARGHQPQAPPQPSDYETDAPPPALDVPLPPPRSNEELNFSVLQRTYPELIAIEHVTPFAALYVFNLETQAWEKVGVEGTLFICQLTPSDIGAERYCAAILNRKGLDNFYLELTSSENMEIDDPYIIVQGEQGEQVYGLWIFADPPPATTANCRVECAKKIMEIADRAQASREAKGGVGNNGLKQATEQTEAASSEPMGRQLSLRQLFGQQREQDAGISANSHNSHPPQHAYTQQQAYNPGPAQQDVLVDDKERLEVNHRKERRDSSQMVERLEAQKISWVDLMNDLIEKPKALPAQEDSEVSRSGFAGGLKQLMEERREADAIVRRKAKQLVRTYEPQKHLDTGDNRRCFGADGSKDADGAAENRKSREALYYHRPSGTLWREMKRKMQTPYNGEPEIDVLQDQLDLRSLQSETY